MTCEDLAVDQFLHLMEVKNGKTPVLSDGIAEAVRFFARREEDMKRKVRALEERILDLERRKK